MKERGHIPGMRKKIMMKAQILNAAYSANDPVCPRAATMLGKVSDRMDAQPKQMDTAQDL
mgnify:CR=1 FL=1